MPSKQKAGYDLHTNPLHPNADPFKGKIIEVLWKLKKEGKAEATIKNIGKCLKVLARHTDLDNPDSVLTFVATYDRKQGYKRNLIMAYEHYVKLYCLKWTKPKYHENAKMPKIPQESKINLIIANAPLKLGTAIAISRDTGLRPVELMRITLRSLDLANGAIYPETAKGGSPRVLKLRNSTLNVLNKYLANRKIELNENIFGTWNSDTYGKWFRYYRNKTAEKLQDFSIKSIRLYDLRHFFATMTYHRTKDILFTKQQMGHKKIETTLVYTQLLQFEKDDSYACKVAKNIDEATELIENGFEYVTEMDEVKLFRKRK
jgi:integrase